MTRRRGLVLGGILAIISIPVLLAAADAATFHVANRSDHTILSSGRVRDYVLHVPRGYDALRATPLVISLHPAGLWGAAQERLSGWDSVADAEGFIVAYPSASRSSGLRVWNVNRGAGLREDVRFIAELIDTLRAHYDVDSTRIYVDGLSNGGGMAFVLSCTLSDRIAAVGIVASAQTLPFRWCRDSTPVPVVAIHGSADPITPYHGGQSWLAPEPFPDMPAFVASWARRNRCGQVPVEARVAAGVVRREHMECADDASVALYSVEAGGHVWPGGGALPEAWVGASSIFPASRVLWSFYRTHSLRDRSLRRDPKPHRT